MIDETSSTSTSTAQSFESMSSTNTPAYDAIIKQLSKPQTTAQIKAHGEVKTKIAILWFIGVVCGLLIIIGGIALIMDPENAKNVWVIIGPILSSAITGTVAYFSGGNSPSSK